MQAKWYRAWKGDRSFLPGSQKEGIHQAQDVLVPLQAAISLVSGDMNGDMHALRKYMNLEHVWCMSCQQLLNKQGDGHTVNCELLVQAEAVLNAGPEYKLARHAAETEAAKAKAEKKAALEKLRTGGRTCE
jgi:hypothetical protein